MHAGTLLHITSELLSLGRTSIRFVHRMYDSATNEEVARTELVGVYFDTTARAGDALPELVRERAAELLVDDDDADAPDIGPSHDVRGESARTARG
jgi:acyl-CoA thioesterase FadM